MPVETSDMIGDMEGLISDRRVGEETDLLGQHVPLLHELLIHQERIPVKPSESQSVDFNDN